MPDLAAFFRRAPRQVFSGAVFRICAARYGGNTASMQGSLIHGARYNLPNYFGALYTSLEIETARREIARYYTVPPRDGFVEAVIELRLSRVVDLRSKRLLRTVGLKPQDLTGNRYFISQEFGLRAWEAGLEALLVPSAAVPNAANLAVFLDNQQQGWRITLQQIRPV